MRKFTRLFFCLGLAWKLMLVFSLTAHGQSAPVPQASMPIPPIAVGPVMLPFCNDEILLFSNQGDSTVNAQCFGEEQKDRRSPETIIRGARMVRHTFRARSGSGDFYAVSDTKLYKFMQFPWEGSQVRNWYTPVGIPFNADPVFSDQYGIWSENSISFRSPWDKEGVKLYPYFYGPSKGNGASGFSGEPLDENPLLGCVADVTLNAFDYCLQVNGLVFRPNKNLFSGKWDGGTEFFSRRQPVNMVATANKIYVSLAGEGRIVTLSQAAGKRPGEMDEQTILYNIGIVNDPYQNRMAVTDRGVYFVHRANTTVGTTVSFRDEIWFYGLKTGRMTQVFVGRDGEVISALSVISGREVQPSLPTCCTEKG